MNAVICLRSLPFTIFGGVRAITTSTPAFMPVCAPKFFAVEDERRAVPVGSARKLIVRWIGAGVCIRSAQMRKFLRRDPRQIFSALLFRAEQEQRLRQRRSIDARRRARPDFRPNSRAKPPRARNCTCDKPRPPYCFGTFIPNAPICASPSKFFGGISPVRSISSGIDMIAQDNSPDCREISRQPRDLLRSARDKDKSDRNRSGR